MIGLIGGDDRVYCDFALTYWFYLCIDLGYNNMLQGREGENDKNDKKGITTTSVVRRGSN